MSHKDPRMVILSTHVQYFNNLPGFGTGENVAAFLQGKNIPFIFIKHSLYGDNNSRVEHVYGYKLIITKSGFSHLPFMLRSFQDFVITLSVINKIGKAPVFIGINPFNAFLGLMLKKIGKVDRVIFYTAEYTLHRFSNTVLNRIYLSIDRYCARNSDEVWNPSTRILEMRKKVKDQAEKQLFVPHTPSGQIPTKIKVSKIQKLVLVGTLSRKIISFDLIFDAMQKIVALRPYLKLVIVGSGTDEGWIKSRIKDFKLSGNVTLTGYQQHDVVLRTIRKCDLGLAIYSGLETWTYYGDSMKARDYLASGLPVIMTDTCSTADDIKRHELGYLIKTSNQLYDVVNKLCDDNEIYIKLQQNIRNYNKQISLENILTKSSLFQSFLTAGKQAQ